MIYFDNAATTIPYGEALKTYQEVATKIYGNPSSLHQLGTNASRILEASRKQIAGLLGVKSEEIFLRLVGLKVLIGLLRELFLKKLLLANILLSQPLNTLP